MALLAFVAAAAADCSSPVAAGDLGIAVREAFREATAADAAFQKAADVAEAQVACLTERVPPETAAALHRNVGLSRNLDGQPDAALAAFRASRAADPSIALPDAVAPPASDLAALWTLAAQQAPHRTTLARRADALLWVDGTPADTRPADTPAILQIGFDDRVVWSQYVRAGATPELPAYLADGADVRVGRKLTRQERARIFHTLLWTGTGAVTIGAGGLYVLSVQARNEFDEAPSYQGRKRTNALYTDAAVTAAVAVALAAVSLEATF